MSHSQLPVLFLITVWSFSIFVCKGYNQSGFTLDHLVMSMCRIFSCVVGKGICYDYCDLLAKLYYPLPCFILYSKAKFACYSKDFLTSAFYYFCIPVPSNEKDICFGFQFQKFLQVFIEPFNFSFFSLTGWGIDLDYCVYCV